MNDKPDLPEFQKPEDEAQPAPEEKPRGIFQRITIHNIAEALVTACLLWISSTAWSVSQDVAVMKAELDDVKPKDVRDEVRVGLAELKVEMMTTKDVELIVAKVAPWARDQADWVAWRQKMEERVLRTELKLKELERKLADQNPD